MFAITFCKLKLLDRNSLEYKKELFKSTVAFGLLDDKNQEVEGRTAGLLFAGVLTIQHFCIFLDLLLSMQEKSMRAFARDLTVMQLSRFVCLNADMYERKFYPDNLQKYEVLLLLCDSERKQI